jgi:5,5'-dehydrodivanillate O-demethylase oxygenase subunit
MPNMTREISVDGIPLDEMEKHPLLAARLKGFIFHYGQPPDVRRAFVDAMGMHGA